MAGSPLKSSLDGAEGPVHNEALVSAAPQPDAAAILQTLNETARELEDDARNRGVYVAGDRVGSASSQRGTAAPPAMPRVESEPVAGPVPGASPARRVALGVLVALVYVGILTAAGLFISRTVSPFGNGPGTTSVSPNPAPAIVAATPDEALRASGSDATPADAADAARAAVQMPVQPAPVATIAVPVAPESPRRERETPAATVAIPVPPAVPESPPEAAIAIPAPPAAESPGVMALAPAAPVASPVVAPVPPPPVAETPSAAAPSAPADGGKAGQELRARGDERLRQGDVASARLFYERAADAGNARAALLLGSTYDPAFLDWVGVRGMRGDVALAASWYRRARDLGDVDAAGRLQTLPER